LFKEHRPAGMPQRSLGLRSRPEVDGFLGRERKKKGKKKRKKKKGGNETGETKT